MSMADNDAEQTINTGESMKNADITMMSLNKIKMSKNSRHEIKHEDLSGLMESIKSVGLLQPIGVSKNGDGYSICYGNRRFLAASRLGIKKIPVIVHTHKTEAEEDLKNLTENIQRRQISLVEAGRYVDILRKSGMKTSEIAVRLGVSKSYVEHTIKAYQDVPKDFQHDIEVAVTKTKGGSVKKSLGKIPVKAATKILAAKRTYRLNDEQTKYLFRAAKSNDNFQAERCNDYARSLKSGKKDPVGHQEKMKMINVNLLVTTTEYDRLFKKYCTEGPFRGLSKVIAAIASGQIHEKIKIESTY